MKRKMVFLISFIALSFFLPSQRIMASMMDDVIALEKAVGQLKGKQQTDISTLTSKIAKLEAKIKTMRANVKKDVKKELKKAIARVKASAPARVADTPAPPPPPAPVAAAPAQGNAIDTNRILNDLNLIKTAILKLQQGVKVADGGKGGDSFKELEKAVEELKGKVGKAEAPAESSSPVSGSATVILLAMDQAKDEEANINSAVTDASIGFSATKGKVSMEMEVDALSFIEGGEIGVGTFLGKATIGYDCGSGWSFLAGKGEVGYGQAFNPFSYLDQYVESEAFAGVDGVMVWVTSYSTEAFANSFSLFKNGDESMTMNRRVSFANKIELTSLGKVTPQLSIMAINVKELEKFVTGVSVGFQFKQDALELGVEVLSGKDADDKSPMTFDLGLSYGVNDNFSLMAAAGYSKSEETEKMHVDIGFSYSLADGASLENDFRYDADQKGETHTIENHLGLNFEF